ncbi:MAG: penicillin acylase family protein, partial [Myxococcota bacterium]
MFNSSRTLRFLPVLTLCILAACGGSSSSGDDPTDTGSTTATEDTDRRDGGTEDTENDDIGMADTSDLDADEADGGEEEACADPVEPPGRTYEATIRWTQYGVPHVTATDHGSVIFGQAWAVATDHVCTIADQIVRVRSERARYFGPGEDGEHIRSDMGWRVLGVHDEAACRLGTLSAVSLEALHGYVAGYNAYIAQADLPEACAGAPWVKPIDAVDLYAYHIALAVQASGGVLLDFIADTRPPGASKPSQSRELPDLRDIGLGSNGWALGAEKTASGRGMVMGNPHFPWEGALRFHEIHLTIPGELDVYGAAPPGLAGGVILGFNKDVAWTHTVSNSSRLTLYTLDIAPDDPTAYLVDGEVVKMTRKDIAIEVLQEDGSLVTEERDYYYSTYGPIVNLGPVAWNSTLAVTYRDANINNDKLIDTWHALNRADSIAAVQAAHQEHTGIPWVNTLAADREGNTFYIDSTAVPNMSPEATCMDQTSVSARAPARAPMAITFQY